MSEREHRPRVSREQKDRLFDLADTINGTEVDRRYHSALEKVLRCLEASLDEVSECPDCGSSNVSTDIVTSNNQKRISLPPGQWRCESCRSRFHVTEYARIEDADLGRMPPVPTRSEGEAADSNGGESGTERTDRRSNPIEGKW